MIKVDAKGKICPIPLMQAKKALNEIEKDGTILVVVDNEIAKENLEKMAKEMGHKCSSNMVNDEHYEVEIIKGLGAQEEPIKKQDVNKRHDNSVVTISSDKMGEGNDELGEVLIKGFIYALTEIDELPSTIIFYNGGAKFAVKQSPVIEDLKKLEQRGVEILTCGTCLNYYNLTNDLAVGSITNMYNIVKKMSEASKIINP